MFDSFLESTNPKRGVAFWRRDRRTTLMTISSGLFAVAPKCPICFLAYLGIFGVATSSASVYRAWLPLITALWLALTIAMLAFQRRGKRRYGPAIMGFVAALLLLIGKFIVDRQVMTFAGIIALLAAAVWRARIQPQIATEVCSRCKLSPGSGSDRLKTPVSAPKARNVIAWAIGPGKDQLEPPSAESAK
jgi:hypothetical protein